MSNVSAVMRCADGLAQASLPSSKRSKIRMQDKVALSAVRTVAVSVIRFRIVQSSKTRNEDRWARCALAWLAEEAATEIVPVQCTLSYIFFVYRVVRHPRTLLRTCHEQAPNRYWCLQPHAPSYRRQAEAAYGLKRGDLLRRRWFSACLLDLRSSEWGPAGSGARGLRSRPRLPSGDKPAPAVGWFMARTACG